MIYQPYLSLRLYEIVTTAIIRAGFRAAQDFIAQQNKEWSYYLGVGIGDMAAATGKPQAGVIIYAVGTTLNVSVLKSQHGSLVRSFLNGVLDQTIDTFITEPDSWQDVLITLVPGVINEIVIENFAQSPNNNSGIMWLGISQLQIFGTNAYILGVQDMSTLAIRIQDSEQNSRLATLPLYLPSGLTVAQIQTYFDAVAPEVDALTDGKIVSAEITLPLVVPGGLKAAALAGILNERGLNILFTTTGPKGESIRIPAIKASVMPGESADLTAQAVANFVTRMTTTTLGVRPTSSNGLNLTGAVAAKRSLRRK